MYVCVCKGRQDTLCSGGGGERRGRENMMIGNWNEREREWWLHQNAPDRVVRVVSKCEFFFLSVSKVCVIVDDGRLEWERKSPLLPPLHHQHHHQHHRHVLYAFLSMKQLTHTALKTRLPCFLVFSELSVCHKVGLRLTTQFACWFFQRSAAENFYSATINVV